MAKEKDVCFSVYLDPVSAKVWQKVSFDLRCSVNGLMRQILESQASDFLQNHPGFLDPAPDQEEN